MSSYTALLDANVLYPAPVRDLLLQLAVTDIYKARWTADIHREWIDNLLENEPQRDRAKLERTRDLMDHATRDALGDRLREPDPLAAVSRRAGPACSRRRRCRPLRCHRDHLI